MANAVVEINTSRTIARQILRHRSFSFQEFSQRYADVNALPKAMVSEARMQDHKNRQNSLDTADDYVKHWWAWKQLQVTDLTASVYKEALAKGIAKEVARDVLPEGLTPSRMYMNGTIRSWMHYVKLRRANGTQKEHQDIAVEIDGILAKELPHVWESLYN